MKTYVVTAYLNEPDDTIAGRLFEAGLDDWLCCHSLTCPYVEAEISAKGPDDAEKIVIEKLKSARFSFRGTYVMEAAL